MTFRSGWPRIFPSGKLLRNLSFLVSATFLGQLITFAATPLLTRLYSPGEFGILGVYVGLLGVISVVAHLRYEMAIPLPLRRGAALQVVGLALACLLAFSALLLVLGLGAGQRILALAGSAVLAPYYWLLPVGLLLTGTYQVGTLWAVRSGAYHAIAVTRLQQGAGTAAAQLGLGLTQCGALGLILGQLLGQSLGLLRLARLVVRDYRRQGARLSVRGMRWAATRYRQFALFDSLASLLDVLSSNAPSILFAALIDPALAGYYLLSLRLLSAPITLVGKTISQVYLPAAIAGRRSGALGGQVLALQKILAGVSFAPFFAFAILTPRFLEPLFGPAWAGAGDIAALTALWVSWQFIYSPLSVVLIAVEGQRTNLIMQLVCCVLRVASILVGYWFFTPTVAVALFALANILFYLAASCIVADRAGARWLSSLRQLGVEMAVAVAIVTPIQLALVGPGRWLWPAVALCVAAWALSMLFGIRRLRNCGAFAAEKNI